MFGFGKKKMNGIVYIDKKRSINLDQAPVISMRQDLENILKGVLNAPPPPAGKMPPTNSTNGPAAQPVPQAAPQTAPPPPQSRENEAIDLSEKYKSSPFLGPDVKVDRNNEKPAASATSGESQKNQTATSSSPIQTQAPPVQENYQVVSDQKNYFSNQVPGADFQTAQSSVPVQTYSGQIPDHENMPRKYSPDLMPPQTNQGGSGNPLPPNQIQPLENRPPSVSSRLAAYPQREDPRQAPSRQTMVKPSFKTNNTSNTSPAPPINPVRNSPDQKTTNDKNSAIDPVWGKLLFSAILIFVILLFIAGGYYFWLTKQTGGKSRENSQAPSTATQNISFSTEQTNPLSININNMNKYDIKNVLKKSSDDLIRLNIKEAVEFNLQSPENDPISFEVFSDKIEMKLPASILYNLDSDFRIFAYNDNQRPSLGLSIDSKDDGKLSEILVGEEMNLAKNMDFFYLTSGYDPESKNFAADSYGGAQIRSLEVNSNDSISFNYAVFKNRLLIGTSKMTLRSMLDYLNREAQVQGIEDIVN